MVDPGGTSEDLSAPPLNKRILVTGATGYVGGRLWRLLDAGGMRVRCLARRPAELASQVGEATEVVQGDVLQAESLETALADVETAYYLIHSMGSGKDFEEQDRTAARNFGSAARRAGVRRIIYLGGLGDDDLDAAMALLSIINASSPEQQAATTLAYDPTTDIAPEPDRGYEP